MSTTIRQAWLRILAAVGVHRFVATSGLGHRFVCHIGDFLGENPFYNRDTFRTELELCAAWLREEHNPIVFDIGANVGFWSTHLAQMLADQSPTIYAFEPVVPTFIKLIHSINRLGLENCVHGIPAAVLEVATPVRLSYSSWNSLFAQVTDTDLNPRVGDQLVYAAGLTLDGFAASLGIIPTFMKIDVEGSEVRVLMGAQELLKRPDRPCLMFEYNPLTLKEAGTNGAQLSTLLAGYTLYYVDDFENQRRPMGEVVCILDDISWVCNLFAIPNTESCAIRWSAALENTQHRLLAQQNKPF